MRTRSAAASLAQEGRVRVNGERISAASRPVRVGDVLTVGLDRIVRVLKVTGFAERRGSAESTGSLFEDLSGPAAAPAPPSAEPPRRDPGMGRPTKQERRALDRFKRGGDE